MDSVVLLESYSLSSIDLKPTSDFHTHEHSLLLEGNKFALYGIQVEVEKGFNGKVVSKGLFFAWYGATRNVPFAFKVEASLINGFIDL
jgi:hypothetical protein